MNNSQQHLGNEANVPRYFAQKYQPCSTFLLSDDFIFLMVSPLLGRFLVSFNLQSAICGLQSAVCSLQSAVCGLQSAVCSLQMSYTEISVTLFLVKLRWPACRLLSLFLCLSPALYSKFVDMTISLSRIL